MGAGAPPVIEAVKDGKVDAVRSLLAKRVDPNAAETDGTTALHWAAHFDNLAAADLLLKAGANGRPQIAMAPHHCGSRASMAARR